jgi:hypothetical protein
MKYNYFLTSYHPTAALEICDQAKIILADMLPGCAARRFDLPNAPNDYWWVEPCFVDRGPIVPRLSLASNPHYYTTVRLYVTYGLMLRDPRELVQGFYGPRIIMGVPLEIGPAAIADNLYDALVKADYTAMLAAGTIERILAKESKSPAPWTGLELSLCAIYLGQYGEAQKLLLNSLEYADQKGRQYYGKLGPYAETYLSRLRSDPDRLRQDLLETMEYNWSHFKIVSE